MPNVMIDFRTNIECFSYSIYISDTTQMILEEKYHFKLSA